MGDVYYRSTVVRIGVEVPEMLAAGTVIFFADPVPEALEEVSIIHSPELTTGRLLKVGHVVRVGAYTLTVRAVGDLVSGNLHELGHLVLYCDGAAEPLLPGAVHVDPVQLSPAVGDVIELAGE